MLRIKDTNYAVFYKANFSDMLEFSCDLCSFEQPATCMKSLNLWLLDNNLFMERSSKELYYLRHLIAFISLLNARFMVRSLPLFHIITCVIRI